MKTPYAVLQNADLIEHARTPYVGNILHFFQSHLGIKPLNTHYLHHSIVQFTTLGAQNPELKAKVDKVTATVQNLLSKIQCQETADDLANALMLTTQYVNGNLTMEDFPARLQQECHVALQPQPKFIQLGYILSAALIVGTTAFGLAFPYILLAALVAALMTGMTYQQANDPRRMLGEQLFQAELTPIPPRQPYEADTLSEFGI